MEATDLSGEWRAARPGDAGEDFFRPEFDDASFQAVPVPGHWQTVPAFSDYPETIVYRRRFAARGFEGAERAWLEIGGVFYRVEGWLDGDPLGEHEGYAAPWRVEVTRWIAAMRSHVLALRVTCERERNVRKKRQVLGVYGHWDAKPPDAYAGGIAGPVRLRYSSEVFLSDLRVRAEPSKTGGAKVSMKLRLDSSRAFPGARIEALVRGDNFTGGEEAAGFPLPAAAGERDYAAMLDMREARLWTTWDRGFPHLYRLRLALRDGDRLLALGEARFGVRTVEMRRLHVSLNGRRLFCRGTNYGPPALRPAEARDETVRDDVRLMREANVNFIRVHAHVAPESFYRACDESGILVWQDFPLQWGYGRDAMAPALHQIRAMTRRLYNHPSIAVWCCHNAPFFIPETPENKWRAALATLRSMTFDAFNMRVLDPALEKAVREEDRTRPVVRYSGVLGLRFPNSDGHMYCGWYFGDMRMFRTLLKWMGHNFRFVTEYGSQSFPALDSLAEFGFSKEGPAPDWYDWEALNRTAMCQTKNLHARVDPREARSPEDYAARTHAYQSELIKYHNELCRLRRYRPAGGVLQFFFADCAPGVTWSVVDWRRCVKPGYHAMKESFRPVQALTDWPAKSYRAGKTTKFRIYAVNDLDRDAGKPEAVWSVVFEDRAVDAGAFPSFLLPADSLVPIGEVRFRVPGRPGGSAIFRISLNLKNGGLVHTDYVLPIR